MGEILRLPVLKLIIRSRGTCHRVSFVRESRLHVRVCIYTLICKRDIHGSNQVGV